MWCLPVCTVRKGGILQSASLAVRLQATSVRLYWNSTATAMLAITASDVDATNQSYYGEQKIHYLAADGTNDCLVPSLKVPHASLVPKSLPAPCSHPARLTSALLTLVCLTCTMKQSADAPAAVCNFRMGQCMTLSGHQTVPSSLWWQATCQPSKCCLMPSASLCLTWAMGPSTSSNGSLRSVN